MKSIFQSKTFYVAMIQALIAIVVTVQMDYPEVGGLLFAKSLLDVILRYVTKKSIV